MPPCARVGKNHVHVSGNKPEWESTTSRHITKALQPLVPVWLNFLDCSCFFSWWLFSFFFSRTNRTGSDADRFRRFFNFLTLPRLVSHRKPAWHERRNHRRRWRRRRRRRGQVRADGLLRKFEQIVSDDRSNRSPGRQRRRDDVRRWRRQAARLQDWDGRSSTRCFLSARPEMSFCGKDLRKVVLIRPGLVWGASRGDASLLYD